VSFCPLKTSPTWRNGWLKQIITSASKTEQRFNSGRSASRGRRGERRIPSWGGGHAACKNLGEMGNKEEPVGAAGGEQQRRRSEARAGARALIQFG
jgi:hypothetical protein